jgi:hypothetical protein
LELVEPLEDLIVLLRGPRFDSTSNIQQPFPNQSNQFEIEHFKSGKIIYYSHVEDPQNMRKKIKKFWANHQKIKLLAKNKETLDSVVLSPYLSDIS